MPKCRVQLRDSTVQETNFYIYFLMYYFGILNMQILLLSRHIPIKEWSLPDLEKAHEKLFFVWLSGRTTKRGRGETP